MASDLPFDRVEYQNPSGNTEASGPEAFFAMFCELSTDDRVRFVTKSHPVFFLNDQKLSTREILRDVLSKMNRERHMGQQQEKPVERHGPTSAIPKSEDLRPQRDRVLREHEQIFRRLDKIADAVNKAPSSALIDVKGMIGEARAHFSYEEDVLRDNGYPRVDVHAALHSQLLDLMQDLLRCCTGDASSQDTLRTVDALRQALKQHTEYEEGVLFMRYADRV